MIDSIRDAIAKALHAKGCHRLGCDKWSAPHQGRAYIRDASTACTALGELGYVAVHRDALAKVLEAASVLSPKRYKEGEFSRLRDALRVADEFLSTDSGAQNTPDSPIAARSSSRQTTEQR